MVIGVRNIEPLAEFPLHLQCLYWFIFLFIALKCCEMGIVEEGLECDDLKFMNKDLGNVEKSNNVKWHVMGQEWNLLFIPSGFQGSFQYVW